MISFRRITILYFSSLFAIIIIGKLFGVQVFSMLKSIGVWVIPLFIIAIGQTIGFIVSLSLEKPHLKQKAFNISYSIVFLCFIATVFYFQYSSWRHEKKFGNIEANQDHFIYFNDQYKTQEKTAFDSLSRILSDPNSFRLTGGSGKYIDTVVNGFSDTNYLVTLQYKKEIR